MTHPNTVFIVVNNALRDVGYLKQAVYDCDMKKTMRILESDIRARLRKDIIDLIRWSSKAGELAMVLIGRLDNLDESLTLRQIMDGQSNPTGMENTLRAFLEETKLIEVEPINAPPVVKALLDKR